MRLFIFARFRAREGQDQAVAQLIRDVLEPTAAEAACLAVGAYRVTGDAGCFYIHSSWSDEAAFLHHATLPHTIDFLRHVAPLLTTPAEVVRTAQLDEAV